MPEPAGADGLPVCRADELAERGDAVVWDVLLWRQPARAFALRIDGRPVAWINRCTHVPMEMDWQPGRFLDERRETIICSTHGALYSPTSGRCLGGPCGRGRLMPVAVDERDGQVYWYPSADIRAPQFDEPAAGAPPHGQP